MQYTRTITALLLSVALSAGAVGAKTLRNAQEPAEFPPSSFSGKQYVDSRGCVYIRAGIANRTTWIPRVTRSRQVVCGQKPTFARATAPATAPTAAPTKPARVTSAPAVAPKPAAAAPRRVVRAPKPAATPRRVVRAPKPAVTPRRVARRVVTPPKPAVAPRRVVRRVVTPPKPVAAPAPRRVVRRVVTPPKPTTRRVVRRTPSSCANLSPVGRQYMNNGDEYPVRCGPQAESPTGHNLVVRGSATRAVTRAPAVRTAQAAAAPRTTVRRRAKPTTPPAGYRAAWSDDRLNPNRGGTARGNAQTALMWTNDVPRRLVEVSTGRDVTALYPKAPRHADDRPDVHSGGSDTSSSAARARRTVRTTTPRAAATATAASHRYVQVGTYGKPANARKVIARLKRLGLPVRVSNITQGGRALQTVLAGPFSRQANLNAALKASRRAGFKDAMLRR